jgi:CRP-like cAMP-binding protein
MNRAGKLSARGDDQGRVACANGTRGFFCCITGPHLEQIERRKVERHFERGETVFREGDPADAVHCIQRGVVKLYKLGPDGEELVIRLLGAGDIMGYRPLLANDAFAATARVLEATTVCTFEREFLFNLLRDSPDLAMHIMKKLASELRVSEDQMMSRIVEHVAQRTARFLLWLLETRAESDHHAQFESALRREDMAMVIGTTPETLSRVLHDLERREIVGLSRKAIRIREPARLRLLAEEGILN